MGACSLEAARLAGLVLVDSHLVHALLSDGACRMMAPDKYMLRLQMVLARFVPGPVTFQAVVDTDCNTQGKTPQW